jgi:c-di-AMP phosphodiesterase-like protein
VEAQENIFPKILKNNNKKIKDLKFKIKLNYLDYLKKCKRVDQLCDLTKKNIMNKDINVYKSMLDYNENK